MISTGRINFSYKLPRTEKKRKRAKVKCQECIIEPFYYCRLAPKLVQQMTITIFMKVWKGNKIIEYFVISERFRPRCVDSELYLFIFVVF